MPRLPRSPGAIRHQLRSVSTQSRNVDCATSYSVRRATRCADTRKHMALAAVLAWIGIGADGLSSSSYGPAEAFIALGRTANSPSISPSHGLHRCRDLLAYNQ